MTQDSAPPPPASVLLIEDRPVEGHGTIRRIAIDRPERLNALNAATLDALQAAFDAAAADPAVRVVVLTGSGPKAFVAGALAAAGSFGPAFAIATADGVIGFTAEVVPIAVVSLGIGVAAFFGTYQTPNAV